MAIKRIAGLIYIFVNLFVLANIEPGFNLSTIILLILVAGGVRMAFPKHSRMI